MNNISELLTIIADNKSFSFKELCETYTRKNKIVLSPNHKITMARTLNDCFNNLNKIKEK